jgi:hypothetical protein
MKHSQVAFEDFAGVKVTKKISLRKELPTPEAWPFLVVFESLCLYLCIFFSILPLNIDIPEIESQGL